MLTPFIHIEFSCRNKLKSINFGKGSMMETLEKRISTESLANIFGVKSQTIRRSLCLKGHYYTLTPVRMPNRRLMWNYDEALKLIK